MESSGFDFHWFKLCLIAVVMLWVTRLCSVYSSCHFCFSLKRCSECVCHTEETPSRIYTVVFSISSVIIGGISVLRKKL